MVGSGPATRWVELGDFLRRRREALRPADLGLPPGQRRRTPGLRRHEVADLANMSTAYYERLEQGQGARPSTVLLGNLARALQLGACERDYVYRLSGYIPPAAHEPRGYVDPGLLRLLTGMRRTAPGHIHDSLGTVVAQNDLSTALLGHLAGRPGHGANIHWRWFTSPAWRNRVQAPARHEPTSRTLVANLRSSRIRRDDDREAAALVTALQQVSVEFATLWDRHEVSAPRCPVTRIDDERVGRLYLECTVALSPASQQQMLVMQPVPCTGTDVRLAQLDAYLHDSSRTDVHDRPEPSPGLLHEQVTGAPAARTSA